MTLRSALLVLLTSCAACGGGDRVVVGSKNFTEQVVLGELLAQAIERQTNMTVERRLNLGGTAIASLEAFQGAGPSQRPDTFRCRTHCR